MRKNLPQFPRIPRFITEDLSAIRVLFLTKLVLVSLVSAILMTQIIKETITLPQNFEAATAVQTERQKITAEIAHWKNVADQYTGYRDVYYRIGFLEYTQGNMTEAKAYIQKALEVDPNFDAGRVLGEKIGF